MGTLFKAVLKAKLTSALIFLMIPSILYISSNMVHCASSVIKIDVKGRGSVMIIYRGLDNVTHTLLLSESSKIVSVKTGSLLIIKAYPLKRYEIYLLFIDGKEIKVHGNVIRLVVGLNISKSIEVIFAPRLGERILQPSLALFINSSCRSATSETFEVAVRVYGNVPENSILKISLIRKSQALTEATYANVTPGYYRHVFLLLCNPSVTSYLISVGLLKEGSIRVTATVSQVLCQCTSSLEVSYNSGRMMLGAMAVLGLITLLCLISLFYRQHMKNI
jgi:hypothetical protein